jgi:hypothetical protein
MGHWVALVLAAQAGMGLPPTLETRYFETEAACTAWAQRITAPPGGDVQIAACLHVRELIARLAQGR